MARVKSSERTYARLWKRFDLLAAMSDGERHEVYQADGMQFLERLMAKSLRGYDVPALESAEAFSQYIVALRANYREWNQRLMTVMINCRNMGDTDSLGNLADFVSACPWKRLVEAARNFTLSQDSYNFCKTAR